MRKLEKPSLSIGVHKASIRKGVQVADIINSELIPDEFITVTTTMAADKKAVLKALKAGEEVKGAELKTNPNTITIK